MKTGKKRRALRMWAAPAMAALLVFLPTAALPGVDTLSTGVGQEGRSAGHREFSLKVVFAERLGPYVAGVSLKIVDEGGQALVDTLSAGPWFYAKLPPGNYRVHARRNGARTEGTVEITGVRQKVLYLTFPARR